MELESEIGTGPVFFPGNDIAEVWNQFRDVDHLGILGPLKKGQFLVRRPCRSCRSSPIARRNKLLSARCPHGPGLESVLPKRDCEASRVEEAFLLLPST